VEEWNDALRKISLGLKKEPLEFLRYINHKRITCERLL